MYAYNNSKPSTMKRERHRDTLHASPRRQQGLLSSSSLSAAHHAAAATAAIKYQWHIGTYVRFLPSTLKRERRTAAVEVAHRDVEAGPGDSRSVLELKVPADADPSFSLSTDTGVLRYEFDKVFDTDATQSTVFDVAAKEKILGAFDGLNSTIFAYGQTGSGKTHTMFGGESFQDRGLIPRSIACLFKEYRAKKNLNYSVRCRVSFTEVYKETVYDLLDQKKKTTPSDQWTAVQVLETDAGMTLRNVNVFDIETEDDALSLFFLGAGNRHTVAGTGHAKSSRSHAIFTMIVECKGMRNNGKTAFTSGKINLVDLAGSERIHRGLNTKDAIEEAKSINLALHYLENVIVSLRDHRYHAKSDAAGDAAGDAATSSTPGGGHGHVPYRNSMLTSVLRDSLGGNCRTAFILHLATDRAAFEETVSTCRFGQRLADVKVHVHANVEVSMVDQLKATRAQLRGLDRRCLMLEEEKVLLTTELAAQRQSFVENFQPRTLTPQEKQDCKQCVQNLFAAAKDAAAITAAAIYSEESSSPNNGHAAATNATNATTATAGGGQSSTSSPDHERRGATPKQPSSSTSAATAGSSPPPDNGTTLGSVSDEVGKIVTASQEDLYAAVEQMDRAVLIELSTALGGLVQTMYLEREKARAEEHKRQLRKQHLVADREARTRAKTEAEQQERDRRAEAAAAAAAAVNANAPTRLHGEFAAAGGGPAPASAAARSAAEPTEAGPTEAGKDAELAAAAAAAVNASAAGGGPPAAQPGSRPASGERPEVAARREADAARTPTRDVATSITPKASATAAAFQSAMPPAAPAQRKDEETLQALALAPLGQHGDHAAAATGKREAAAAAAAVSHDGPLGPASVGAVGGGAAAAGAVAADPPMPMAGGGPAPSAYAAQRTGPLPPPPQQQQPPQQQLMTPLPSEQPHQQQPPPLPLPLPAPQQQPPQPQPQQQQQQQQEQMQKKSSPSPPKVPKIMLSEETYQMLVRGDTFFVANFLGVRSSRHYFVWGDLKGFGWRPTASVATSNQNSKPFAIFTQVKYDDTQSRRGVYVLTFVPKATNEKALTLEYQTPIQAKAAKWHQALSFCIDKANGRI